mmetsp:Transcript_28029/g.39605  ORF Transcript_28029/g.39605 Transcript_28029/m.39605 type:complete len:91 (+) Transcript_28029:136-408(+)
MTRRFLVVSNSKDCEFKLFRNNNITPTYHGSLHDVVSVERFDCCNGFPILICLLEIWTPIASMICITQNPVGYIPAYQIKYKARFISSIT